MRISDWSSDVCSSDLWIVDGYTLAFAALLLAAGALSDRYGAKPVYLAGLAVFTLASLLCGAAPSSGLLVAARMLPGLGAALFLPLGRASCRARVCQYVLILVFAVCLKKQQK